SRHKPNRPLETHYRLSRAFSGAFNQTVSCLGQATSHSRNKMLNIRNSILSHLRGKGSAEQWLFTRRVNVVGKLQRHMFSSAGASHDQILGRVVGLVKKFDKIDASKVTETADFQKDLSLDSLDRVELVMAFEEEFSIEIPDDKADKLTCCADVAKYIASGENQKVAD
ncbi:hypothetical protein Tsubulata_037799, partial [Turnera subulata]